MQCIFSSFINNSKLLDQNMKSEQNMLGTNEFHTAIKILYRLCSSQNKGFDGNFEKKTVATK